MSESNSWDKVMNLALSMPMVKVDRTAFLTKEFSMYDNDNPCPKIQNKNKNKGTIRMFFLIVPTF